MMKNTNNNTLRSFHRNEIGFHYNHVEKNEKVVCIFVDLQQMEVAFKKV